MAEKDTAGQERRQGGVRLRILLLILVSIAACVVIALIYTTYRSLDCNRRVRLATEEYIVCQTYAQKMLDASDTLTEAARAFAVTGGRQYLDEYFKEVEEDHRRDEAREGLAAYAAEAEALGHLDEALAASRALTEREYTAMRLAAEAAGFSLAELPETLRGTALDAAAQSLSPEAKRQTAQAMLFDDEYAAAKDEIRGRVASALAALIESARQKQENGSARLALLLKLQTVFALTMMALLALGVTLTVRLVIIPLRRSVDYLQRQQQIPVKGSREMQALAESYNSAFQQSREKQKELSYAATHDPLTGLNNRGVFETLCGEVCDEETALLVIDIYRFKSINDTYGHDAGDRVLKRVAHALSASFRPTDCVCRIGGDEFTVLLFQFDAGQRRVLEEKIDRLNAVLGVPEENTPAAALSVGAAFGADGRPLSQMYKSADTALYRRKASGGAGITFAE